MLPILMLTPGWAGSDPHEIPADPSSYAEYVAHVVERYGPHGSFWLEHPSLAQYAPAWFELWNEPYYTSFSDNNVDAGRYARLVAAAGAAGHQADPSSRFLIEATAQWDDHGRWTSWVNSLYQAVPDLNDYFDAVAVHPYGPSLTDPYETNGFYQDLVNVREAFVAHAAAEKPFWITEIGYPTCPAGQQAGCYSETQQAEKLATLNTLLTTTYKTYVRHVLIYDYSDTTPPSQEPTSQEDHYGITQLDGTPKPGAEVIKQAIWETTH